jgi:hypothetical protein
MLLIPSAVTGLCTDFHPLCLCGQIDNTTKLTDQLTPQSIIFLKKLIIAQLVKKFLAFHGTRSFIAVFKEPATGPYHEPNESSAQLPTLFL